MRTPAFIVSISALALVATSCRAQSQETISCETLATRSAPVRITTVAPGGDPTDWFELYNDSSEYVDLSAWHFSDDRERPKRARFPRGNVIAPRSRMRVFVSRDQFGFGLGKGEELVIIDGDNHEVDFVDWKGDASSVDVSRCEPSERLSSL